MLWRSVDSVQVELGSRAIIVEGVDSSLIRALTERSPTIAESAPRIGGRPVCPRGRVSLTR